MSAWPSPPALPSWLTWWQRPFPDANILLLPGQQPALVDTGFVGHADETTTWAYAHAGTVDLVVNTHWHSDHVGGNALLQARGAAIAAGTPEAEAITRRDPGCCAAEYLDQPVAPYTVDVPLDDGQVLQLGDADWEAVRTPGHTPGHLALWQPDERLLVVGDALSDYDVGWVNLALDGLDAATTALASLKRMADLDPRVLLPSHGPIPADPAAAFAAALRRAQRLVDNPAGAVWYGARRILAFALMIRDGIPSDEVEPYLHGRAWLTDAARLLDVTPEVLAPELVTTMLRSGAIVLRNGRLHAAADHTPVAPEALRVPYPRAWPVTEPR
ncbi:MULTISPECIES: MBL fold metallo-hydrolase [Streptomyces]|uniref:MBL fold metallo-hydrolase n=1 Tax=Streptomyces caniscabiei TaxID=2746961 RepID=A0ABU4MHL9_9ACTN|nr:MULTISPECIES: MBL fold metallo-hydrolase [Streptomyces]MBE4736533.1 MBL fold metallo-hydrolase [Streptomyces caniscabiei]MBE4760763.1 MBL fold metallo-hydrolase [Streptomyces caniscabiei]MBE4770457.1 MBL fold metallo-hydrolase [Streptomyces caniscabiei]MBE4786440.1 MBL fold metallo-hydrolase [Streptomyces caniscabiei]MBE4796569.1 MBL fold metallo-hydrolase [Streptomyces caniscabiei]